MNIGELAARAAVPAKTIRYYEQIGVLPPAARQPNGYRAYDDAAIQALRFVRAAQTLGLTLGEIREVIAFRRAGATPCTHVQQLLDRRATELDERIAELERLRGELRALGKRAARLDPRDCQPSQICHVIP